MAIALVRRQAAQNTSADPSVFSGLTASTAGNFLVAVFTIHTGTTNPITGVTDSGSNTWTHRATGETSGSNRRIEIWTAPGTSSVTSVTADFGSAAVCSLDLYELSGADTTTPVNTFTSGSDGTANTTAEAGTLTTTVADCFLIHGVVWTSTSTMTATGRTAGYTQGANLASSGTTLKNICTAYQLVTTATGYTCSFTISASVTNNYAAIAIAPAAGGGGPVTVLAPLTTASAAALVPTPKILVPTTLTTGSAAASVPTPTILVPPPLATASGGIFVPSVSTGGAAPNVSATVGNIECPGATGSQATSGLGFQPKALIVWTTGQTTSGVTGGAAFGMGFGTGGSEQTAIGLSAQDASAQSNTSESLSSSLIVNIPNNAGSAAQLAASLTSFDADGFTLNWTTVISGADIHYLALGGAGITSAKAGVFQKAAATGNQAITDPGFQPGGLLLFGTNRTSLTTGAGLRASFLGASDASLNQWAVGLASEDGLTDANSGRRFTTNQIAHIPNSSGLGVSVLGSLNSFDATGFTINWGTGTTQQYFGYLALRGVSLSVGTITQKTSTGSQATTGISSPPSALLLASHGSTSTAIGVADVSASFGAGVSSVQRAATWAGDNNAAATMETDVASNTDKIISIYEPGTPTILAEADLTSLDSGGWTLNWTTADATARVIGYVAILGSSPVTLSTPLTTASGAALVPAPRIAVPTPLTTATGDVAIPTTTILVPAPLTTASAQAYAAALSIAAAMPLTTATGEAYALSFGGTVVGTPLTTASAQAYAPTLLIGPSTLVMPLTTALAASYDPTMRITAAMPLATASGAVFVPTTRVAILTPTATGTGAAVAPLVRVIVGTSLATAAGGALLLVPEIGINTPLTTGSGAALVPTVVFGNIVVALPLPTATADVLAAIVKAYHLVVLRARFTLTPTVTIAMQSEGALHVRIRDAHAVDARMQTVQAVATDIETLPALGVDVTGEPA